MKIALGSDHAGFLLKEEIKKWLQHSGHTVDDFGTHSETSVDYPDFVIPAAQSVAEGLNERAIVFGGSGNGEAIAANKVKGIRCALCWHEDSGRLASEHNNANVIALGGRMVSPELGIRIVELWLSTPFEGGRHQIRLQKITNFENSQDY